MHFSDLDSLRIGARLGRFRRALQVRLTCCALCGGALDAARDRLAHADLCDACRVWLPPLDRPGIDRLCVGCGRPAPPSLAPPTYVCRHCEHRAPLFDRMVAAVRYDWPVDRLIGDLKYRNGRRLATPLGALLADAVEHDRIGCQRPWPDMLLPVPPHRRRWRERGYDHARDLARRCGRDLGLPVRHDLLERVVDTGAQASRTSAEREFAIRGAFTADERLAGRRVAIIDDVLTSGATARELARELYDTGVESIELWSLARTPLEDGSNTRRRTAGGSAAT